MLSARFERRQQREELLFGILAAANANYGFHAPQDAALQPWDFIPSLQPPPPLDLSDEQIAAHFDSLLGPLAVPASQNEAG